jgi:predicted aldo/keto reductase-like oxidoreductase
MGVFIISPSDKGGKLYEPPEKLMRLCAPLHPMAFNNLFCLGHPEIHTLSVGAARPSDFDAHTASLAFLGKSQHLVSDISARLEKAMEDALGADWMRGWETGIPEWDKCPGGVNAWEILRLWNFAKGLDMLAFARMRYNLLEQADHWFPGKNAAVFSDAEMLSALAGSPFKERIPGILREAHELFSDKPAQRLGRT